MSDFDAVGGEAGLRAIIDDFVGRVFDDVMIGFMFRRARRERVARFEYEHAAEHLGAPLTYSGRALREAHAAHRIQGGQFMRRLQILRETLRDHGVPEAIAEQWIAHHESLRGEITAQPGSECR